MSCYSEHAAACPLKVCITPPADALKVRIGNTLACAELLKCRGASDAAVQAFTQAAHAAESVAKQQIAEPQPLQTAPTLVLDAAKTQQHAHKQATRKRSKQGSAPATPAANEDARNAAKPSKLYAGASPQAASAEPRSAAAPRREAVEPAHHGPAASAADHQPANQMPQPIRVRLHLPGRPRSAAQPQAAAAAAGGAAGPRHTVLNPAQTAHTTTDQASPAAGQPAGLLMNLPGSLPPAAPPDAAAADCSAETPHADASPAAPDESAAPQQALWPLVPSMPLTDATCAVMPQPVQQATTDADQLVSGQSLCCHMDRFANLLSRL